MMMRLFQSLRLCKRCRLICSFVLTFFFFFGWLEFRNVNSAERIDVLAFGSLVVMDNLCCCQKLIIRLGFSADYLHVVF
jgi:hypothetical protein